MLKAIFAIDLNGGMGFKGTLPWPHDHEDMKWFKLHTQNQIIVMGSKTWSDPNMRNPLPNRINVVISDKSKFKFFGADHIIKTYDIKTSLLELQSQYKNKICWIIGGAKLLTLLRNSIDNAYVTHYQSRYEVDTILDTNYWFTNTTILEEIHNDNKIFRLYKCEQINFT